MDLKALNAVFREALPQGWRGKVVPYGGGILGYVQRARHDLLAELRERGLPLGMTMHYATSEPNIYLNFMGALNASRMHDLWKALVGGVSMDTSVFVGIGHPDDPFLHVVKPPKKLHPKVQAYADHAKALEDKYGSDPEHDFKVGVVQKIKAMKAKRLFPHGKPKHAHHTWT
jgi:hypothetical protein